MLFNSLEYLIFLPIVFGIYWLIFRKYRNAQNILLLVASYFFYGFWDWRFLILIAVSSLIDYLCGLRLEKVKSRTQRKWLLWTSIITNLSILGFFKYFNFFLQSATELLTYIGLQVNPGSLQIILPIGISFYTFQSMSYTIDIYRRKSTATKDPITFFAYVAFFPQLVAGPIERASHLLPQFARNRKLDYVSISFGLKLILWGLFKKMVVADNCAPIVDWTFKNYQELNSWQLLYGLVLVQMQIYADFSGYCDIAIGSAALLGFSLKRNFETPIFSTNVIEYWRRWHISLYTWFRDYVYFPLGGNRQGKVKQVRNVFLVFLISSLWHGAGWNFFVWGLVNFIFMLPVITQSNASGQTPAYTKTAIMKEIAKMVSVFLAISFSKVFFRAENLSHSFQYLYASVTNWSSFLPFTSAQVWLATGFAIIQIIIEWRGKNYLNNLEGVLSRTSRAQRWMVYYALTFSIIFIGGSKREFYYFQF